jgi:hypothetical protein
VREFYYEDGTIVRAEPQHWSAGSTYEPGDILRIGSIAMRVEATEKTPGPKSHTMAIPSPEGMTPDDLKMALLSALESEHLGTLQEIDKRLRARKILIEGYRIDPIIGYVAVKIDVLREIRPPDELKTLADEGTRPLLEDVFGGLPGYVVVTDAQVKVMRT